jgi:hypothetical protein
MYCNTHWKTASGDCIVYDGVLGFVAELPVSSIRVRRFEEPLILWILIPSEERDRIFHESFNLRKSVA